MTTFYNRRAGRSIFSNRIDGGCTKLNEVLAQYAVQEEKITGEKQRMDTTAYESNIHYPTDSSLLWDGFRTLARLVRNLQNELPQLELRHRFHDRRIKKLATFIARTAMPPATAKRLNERSTWRLTWDGTFFINLWYS